MDDLAKFVDIARLDVNRHAGIERPAEAVPKPQLGSTFSLNPAVIRALPLAEARSVSGRSYGMSLWGKTAKVTAELPGGSKETFFLKVMTLGETGRAMIEGEFESLKAIHAVSPEFVPKPHAWGKYDDTGTDTDTDTDTPTYFLIAKFREVGDQPPDPMKFTARLADMHRRSVSPTGKFGFHITTCHAKLPQLTNVWEESWAVLYARQLEQMITLDTQKHGAWPEFQRLCDLTMKKVIPRLLGVLQSGGRSIKPCLIHGDLWDENTATDMATGEPFVFDAGSFYGHNEYEIGNWRAARHRLSNRVYVRNYKRNFPVSEPENEWDDRNLLYSLRFDLGTAILIPGCNMRQVVKDGMELLCKKYCPDDLVPQKIISYLYDSEGNTDEEEEELTDDDYA